MKLELSNKQVTNYLKFLNVEAYQKAFNKHSINEIKLVCKQIKNLHEVIPFTNDCLYLEVLFSIINLVNEKYIDDIFVEYARLFYFF